MSKKKKEELTELQGGKNSVVICGVAQLKEEGGSFEINSESKKSKNGWKYSRANIGIKTAEGNVIYVESFGGHAMKGDIVVYTQNKDNEAIQVNWKDRNSEKIMKTINPFKLFKVGIEQDEEGNIIQKEFMAEKDFIEYLKKHLKDGMEIKVKGSFEFQEYEGETRRKISINSVQLLTEKTVKKKVDGEVVQKTIKTEDQYLAKGILTLLIEEDTFSGVSKNNKEDGYVTVQCYTPYYVGKPIKKNLAFTCPITFKLKDSKTAKMIEKLMVASKGRVTELTITFEIREGYDSTVVDEDTIEIDEEMQELIDLGAMTLDDVIEQMTIRGNKISQLVFLKPLVTKTEDGKPKLMRTEDKYPSELLYEEEEEEDDELGTETSLDDDDDDDDDESWLDDMD